MKCVRIWAVGNACLDYLVVCRWLLHERIVVSTSFLVQVSLSRLGESNRGSPRLFHASCRSGDQLCFERESVSPRRGESRLSENAQKPLFLCVELSPRWRELAWARDPLAWARPFSLSEGLGESAFWFDIFSVLGCLACIWLDYYTMAWGEWICMSGRVYELWMMNLDNPWHVMNMKWLVIKVTWYWYEIKFYIHGWRMMSWYGFDLAYKRGWL